MFFIIKRRLLNKVCQLFYKPKKKCENKSKCKEKDKDKKENKNSFFECMDEVDKYLNKKFKSKSPKKDEKNSKNNEKK